VHCVPLVRGSIRAAAWVRHVCLRKSNYVKIIPMHMMIREIILGRQQRVRRCIFLFTNNYSYFTQLKILSTHIGIISICVLTRDTCSTHAATGKKSPTKSLIPRKCHRMIIVYKNRDYMSLQWLSLPSVLVKSSLFLLITCYWSLESTPCFSVSLIPVYLTHCFLHLSVSHTQYSPCNSPRVASPVGYSPRKA